MAWLFGAFVAVAAAAAPLPKIAVLDIRALDGPSKAQTEIVQEVLLADLASTKQFEVIGASDIAAMLGLERQKQLLGCAEEASSCLAELGGALGAEYVLLGSVARLDQTRRVDLKLMDSARNRVIARDYATAESDNGIIERTRSTLMRMLTAIPGFKPTASAEGRAIPVVPLVTVIGGAVAVIGGSALTAATVSDFNDRRQDLRFSEVAGFETMRNVWVGVAAAGLVATGVGFWLWQQPTPTAARGMVLVVPTEDGLGAAIVGRF